MTLGFLGVITTGIFEVLDRPQFPTALMPLAFVIFGIGIVFIGMYLVFD